MFKRLFLFAFLLGAAFLFAPFVRAQSDSEAADQVIALLTSKGYDVTEVAHFPDEKGNPRADTVYALMDAVKNDIDDREVSDQVVWGFVALHKYYPRVDNLLSVLASGKFMIFFGTTSAALDQFLKKQISGDSFWNAVRSRAKFFDTERQVYVGEKDFTGGDHGTKDQTNKDFSGTTKNPVPGYISSNAAGENLVLEPSTAYLPADGTSSVVLLGTLRDKNFLPLANRGIGFSYDIQGQGTSDLGAQNTDAQGVARASITSKRVFDSVLFRATTASLNSQVSVIVGPTVSSTQDRVNAVVKALTQQGYAEVEANYRTLTIPTGEKINSALAVMRMASRTFDRDVYSQMARAFGTLRTVFPESNRMIVGLIARVQNREFAVWWEAYAAYWDNYVAGKISENDFWRYLQYLGAEDEKGNEIATGDKNFIDKNFRGGGSPREAKIKRTLESAITKQTWGEQFVGQEFVIVAGGYADTFTLADLSGSATGLTIYQAPEFRQPVFTFNKSDPVDRLAQLRLGQGQYYFAVLAPLNSAPAAVRLTYVEHLPQ